MIGASSPAARLPIAGLHVQEHNDNQSEATLLHYWRILKKRQPHRLFCGILMGTVAVGTLLSTPYFGSTATLEISPNAPSVLGQDNMSEVVSLSAHDERRAYYATQYRIMESRTIIEETVNRLQERHGITDFDEVESPYEFYKSHLRIKPDFDSRLVHVIIEYPDYDKAALFANTLAETYIEMNLQRSLDTANSAFSWLGSSRKSTGSASMSPTSKSTSSSTRTDLARWRACAGP